MKFLIFTPTNYIICYFVDNIQQSCICCWGRVYDRKLIRNHLLIDGISMKNVINLKIPFSFHRNWRKNVRKIIEQDIQFEYLQKSNNRKKILIYLSQIHWKANSHRLITHHSSRQKSARVKGNFLLSR